MALINCYECGKKVSDTASACPNCGFPHNEFSTFLNAAKEKKRIEKNLKKARKIAEDKKKLEEQAMKQAEALQKKRLAEIRCHECNHVIGEAAICPHCGFNMLAYKERIEIKERLEAAAEERKRQEKEQRLERERQEKLERDKMPVECPMCGSKNIGVVNRGFSLIWGFAGSGSARNVCQKCGYRWKPGRPDRYS